MKHIIFAVVAAAALAVIGPRLSQENPQAKEQPQATVAPYVPSVPPGYPATPPRSPAEPKFPNAHF